MQWQVQPLHLTARWGTWAVETGTAVPASATQVRQSVWRCNGWLAPVAGKGDDNFETFLPVYIALSDARAALNIDTRKDPRQRTYPQSLLNVATTNGDSWTSYIDPATDTHTLSFNGSAGSEVHLNLLFSRPGLLNCCHRTLQTTGRLVICSAGSQTWIQLYCLGDNARSSPQDPANKPMLSPRSFNSFQMQVPSNSTCSWFVTRADRIPPYDSPCVYLI